MSNPEDPRHCYHVWVWYEGIFDMFEYCDRCGLKRKDSSKVYDKEFLEIEFPELVKKEEKDKDDIPKAKGGINPSIAKKDTTEEDEEEEKHLKDWGMIW